MTVIHEDRDALNDYVILVKSRSPRVVAAARRSVEGSLAELADERGRPTA